MTEEAMVALTPRKREWSCDGDTEGRAGRKSKKLGKHPAVNYREDRWREWQPVLVKGVRVPGKIKDPRRLSRGQTWLSPGQRCIQMGRII